MQAMLASAPPADRVIFSTSLLGPQAPEAEDPGRWLDRHTPLSGVPVLDPATWPAAWRHATRLLTSRADPARAAANLRYFRTWLANTGVPLVDARLQSEAYFAFAWFSETQSEMLFNLQRDYLIERGTTMLDRREELTAEAEVRAEASLREAGTRLRPPGAAVVVHDGTTQYPRLSLGIGQRFAARGARLLRAATNGGNNPGWVVDEDGIP